MCAVVTLEQDHSLRATRQCTLQVAGPPARPPAARRGHPAHTSSASPQHMHHPTNRPVHVMQSSSVHVEAVLTSAASRTPQPLRPPSFLLHEEKGKMLSIGARARGPDPRRSPRRARRAQRSERMPVHAFPKRCTC